MVPVIFIRADVFYSIELMEPSDCGKSLEQQAAENAEMNPGTQRVEDVHCNVLWRLQ